MSLLLETAGRSYNVFTKKNVLYFYLPTGENIRPVKYKGKPIVNFIVIFLRKEEDLFLKILQKYHNKNLCKDFC